MKKIISALLCMAGISGCAAHNGLALKGKLYKKGSAPHSYLVIEDQQSRQSYQIENAGSFHLNKRQKETVSLRAKLLKKAIGPGFPAVIEVTEVDQGAYQDK